MVSGRFGWTSYALIVKSFVVRSPLFPWAVLAAAVYLSTVSCAPRRVSGPARWVDLFIGTDGTGHTFPGPTRPWGMVQPGPDNRDEGWDYTSGYQYRDTLMLGFSQTRANGTGISEFGDLLLQPFSGGIATPAGTGYRKSSERAHPGYYGVELNNGIQAELTSTPRVAMYRFTSSSDSMGLVLDMQHGLRAFTDSLVVESGYTVHSGQRISGFARKVNWVDRRYFFVAEFSAPVTKLDRLPRRAKDHAERLVLHFAPGQHEVQVKIALSTVSEEGAANNLRVELPGWDFDAVARGARDEWNRYLRRASIRASWRVKTLWYTSMYRTLVQPSNIADVDGLFRGPDDQIHRSERPSGAYYSTFSLWDTYRAAHSWYTLIAPEVVPDLTYSMVRHSELFGQLPIWTAWGQENYCMIGNHAVPVLADAAQKGLLGVDSVRVWNAVRQSLTENHRNSDWSLMKRYGYYPLDLVPDESVSRMLEHGVDDAAASLLGYRLGFPDHAQAFARRAGSYRSLWDPETQLLRGRNSTGAWRSPFDSLKATSPLNNPGDYTEANAMQYFWTPAQHDFEGLMALLGGVQPTVRKLDRFFSIPAQNPQRYLGQEAMIGQYAHGNEPSHHIAYLYALAGQPDRTAALVQKILHEFYRPRPDGLIGNDDCGQMSAWYLFSSLGFYPVDPSNATYVIGEMGLRRAVLRSGESTIRLRPGRDGIRINGHIYTGPKLTHHELLGQP